MSVSLPMEFESLLIQISFNDLDSLLEIVLLGERFVKTNHVPSISFNEN